MTTKASPSPRPDVVPENRQHVLLLGTIPGSGKKWRRVGHCPPDDKRAEARNSRLLIRRAGSEDLPVHGVDASRTSAALYMLHRTRKEQSNR